MKYIKGFDGLRAISILFVMATHLGLYTQISNNNFLKNNFNLISGETGVMIFFSISGFLITSLLLSEKISSGKINFKYFFIRRFLRLLPPLLLFFTTTFLLMLSGFLPKHYLGLLLSFFYLYNFVLRTKYFTELGHTWSLGVEEQFYFFWPFFIHRLRNLKKGFIFPVIIIIICLIAKNIFFLPIVFNGKPHFLNDYFFVDRWFIPAVLPIMVGSLTSVVLFMNKEFLQKKLHKNYFFPVLLFLVYIEQIYLPRFPFQIESLFMPIAISLFLLWIYFNQSGSIVSILEFSPIAFIGKISYGIYVYQGLFLQTGPGGKLLIQQFPLNIFLTFVTAILSYYLVEKRIMKYKQKFKIKPS